MKRLTIILGILLAALGCADNKKGDPATLDDGSSKRMTELDSSFHNLHHKGHDRLAGLQPDQPTRVKSGSVERNG